MASKSNKITSKVIFLIAGLLLLIKFIVNGGIPSPSNNVSQFIVGIFTLIALIGFYVYFAFVQKEHKGTIVSLAPAVLLYILYGSYSFNYNVDWINSILNPTTSICFVLMIICGFIYLFIHQKLIGLVLASTSLLYGILIIVSYIVMMIVNLVNGNGFNVTSMFNALLLAISYLLISYGSYKTSINKEW